MDVNVTEKEQDVAPLPGAGPNVKSLSPGKFSIQLDEGKVPEVSSSEREDRHGHAGAHASQASKSPGKYVTKGHPHHLAMFLL